VQHILVACVFSREIWFRVLSLAGLHQCTLEASDEVFQEWWQAAESKVPKQYRPGFNSLVTLVAWCLWKHGNSCVFDETSPSAPTIIQDIKDDARRWCMVGAKGLSSLWP
jgi:hypothetical protein